MTFLHNSRGEHIANFVNGQLHSPRGKTLTISWKTSKSLSACAGAPWERLIAATGSSMTAARPSDTPTTVPTGTTGTPETMGILGMLARLASPAAMRTLTPRNLFDASASCRPDCRPVILIHTP